MGARPTRATRRQEETVQKGTQTLEKADLHLPLKRGHRTSMAGKCGLKMGNRLAKKICPRRRIRRRAPAQQKRAQSRPPLTKAAQHMVRRPLALPAA